MSRKGWQVISTPIGGQTVTNVVVSSPTVNQSLVYNGTNWVNSNITISTGSPIYQTIFNTAASSVNVVSNTTPVPLNNMSGTLTLSVGSYFYTATANITGDVGSGGYGHLKLVKTGGTGTFTHSGLGYSIFMPGGGSAGVITVGDAYNTPGDVGIAISAIGSQTNSTSTSGIFTISTSSVTFTLEYLNDINTGTFTFDQGLTVQFIKIA